MEKIDNKKYYNKEDDTYNKIIDLLIQHGEVGSKSIQRELDMPRATTEKYLGALLKNKVIEYDSGKLYPYKALIPNYGIPYEKPKTRVRKKNIIEDPELYAEFVQHVRETGRCSQKELIEDFKGRCSMEDVKYYQNLLRDRNVIQIEYGGVGEGTKVVVKDAKSEIVNDDMWGSGYAQKDIEQLEKMFKLYVNGDSELGIQGFELKSADSYYSVLSICKNKLQIAKLEERQVKGEDVGKEIKYYSDMNKTLLENAKLTEKQRTGRDYNLSTIGEIIKQVEMEEYVYQDDTIPDDEIDVLIKLFSHTIANGGEDKLWDTREGKIAQLLKEEFGER